MSGAVLRPMDAAAFDRFWQASTTEYASERVRAGQWRPDEALARSQAEFASLLPQGLATPDQCLCEILAPGSGQAVGHLWFAFEDRQGVRVAYVYDLAVDPAHQRQGHATRAFRAMEALVRASGVWRIDLHVFGHNPGAQALYAALGYRVTSVTMAKDLGVGPDPGF